MRVILVALCLLAGNLHGCASEPAPAITPPSVEWGDCSGELASDPCLVPPGPLP